MNKEGSPIKKDLKSLEDVLEPALWTRIASKAWIILVVVLIFGAGTKLVFNYLYADPVLPMVQPKPVLPEIIDSKWFTTKRQHIDAIEAEITSTQQALKRHHDEVKSRSGIFSISREADRNESDRLNHEILVLEKLRVRMIQSYNTKASTADPKDLEGLPIEIEMSLKKKGILDKIFNRPKSE